jgi:hypothetical protein
LLPSSHASWPLPGPTCLASGLGSVAGEEQGAGAEAHRARGCRDGMWGQCGGTRTGWMVGRRFLRFVFCFICFRLFHLECGVTPRLEPSRARSLFPSRQFNPRLLRPEVRRVIEMLLDNDWPGPCVSHRSKVPFLRSIGGPLDPKKTPIWGKSEPWQGEHCRAWWREVGFLTQGDVVCCESLETWEMGGFLLDPMVTPKIIDLPFNQKVREPISSWPNWTFLVDSKKMCSWTLMTLQVGEVKMSQLLLL